MSLEPTTPQAAALWARFKATSAGVEDSRLYEVFAFGDSERLANDLAALVLSGAKRATTSSMWTYEAEGRRPPKPGDFSIVTDGVGTPLCVIETMQVDVMPFEDVSAEFAAAEGEGDGSLAYWREAHTAFFGRECARIGRSVDGSMRVACERFKVVLRA